MKPDTLIPALLKSQFEQEIIDRRQPHQVVAAPISNTIKPNILVVEDNYINQQVVIEMLNNLNCNLSLAENGQQALDLLKSNAAPFDLILMDCQMPIMDGYEASQKIRAHQDNEFDPNIIIIALTANAMKGDDIKCFNAGMNDYLSKPVLSEDLAKILRKWRYLDRRE
jgi:CheY-like chemotaxis protein